jgi:hypothetical protein
MIHITVSTVDGGAQDWTESDSFYLRYMFLRQSGYEGKALVHELITDDWGPPPVGVKLTGRLENGTAMNEYIPYR